jgi:membrane fusion protein, multidrug efflux system
MVRTRIFVLMVVCLSLALAAGCSRPAGESALVDRPAVAVEVSRVAAGNLQESIAVVGTLTPKFEGEVKPEFSGIIKEVYVTEWVRVSRGTLLARYDARDSEAALKAMTAMRLQAEVAVTRARRELERSQKLKAAGLATQQNLDDARTGAEAADAQVAAAKAQEDMARTRLAKTEVRSPLDGVIGERMVNPGDYVQNMGSSTTMFRIFDNRRLELTVSVPSSQIAAVKLAQPLSFTTDAVPGRTFEGRVSFINPAADEASRTVKVVAVVDNASGTLKSGLFVKGAIVTGQRNGVLRIPRSAMITWDPATRAGFVYVVANERVMRKAVTTGVASGEEIEVANGLTAGDAVVTRGAFNLRDGDRVTIVTPTADRLRGHEVSGSRGSTARALCLATSQPRNLVTG